MHYKPFEVEVITKEKVTTQQKTITAILVVYYFTAVFSIAAGLYVNLSNV